MVSTLIADNAVDNGPGSSDPDVLGAFSDANGGYNFIGNEGDATGFTSATDLTGNPIISALGNFGGPTQTIALLNGSPAINKGSNPDGLKYDQRGSGFARVVGPAADIGAYEVQNNMCVCLCMNMDMTTSGSVRSRSRPPSSWAECRISDRPAAGSFMLRGASALSQLRSRVGI